MSNILSFEEHAKSYKFKKEIIDILTEKNPFYEFRQDNNDGIGYLHINKYIYIFFKYIPRGEETTFPNLNDSLQGITEKKRISKGEWVVERIFSLRRKDALKYFPILFKKNKHSGWINDFKERLLKEI